MNLLVQLLFCAPLVSLVFGRNVPRNKPIVVCYVKLQSEVDESFGDLLAQCKYIVVCDDTCVRSNPLVPYRSTNSQKKLYQLKVLAQHATFMQSVVVNPFELQADDSSDEFCQELEHCMDGNTYSGIDLDFDPTVLDVADQNTYTRFLRRLRRRFPSIVISTMVGAARLLPGPLLQTFIDVLDFIIVSRDDSPSSSDPDSEFVLRKYTYSMIDDILQAGFPPEKIVLGLKTVGILSNPSFDKEQHFKKCSKIGLIPYGQVCELKDQSKRYCSWRHDRRCLIFDGQSKVAYDNSATAKERAIQCTTRKLKGISILLHGDDSLGICEGGKFPLMKAILSVFEQNDGQQCTATPWDDNVKSIAEDSRLLNDLTRLEKAIENIEKSTGILQKIVSFLFRTMDKVIDLVISITGKSPDKNKKDDNAAMDKLNSSSVIDGQDSVDMEKAKAYLESVDQDNDEVVNEPIIEEVDNVEMPPKNVILNPIDDKKIKLGAI